MSRPKAKSQGMHENGHFPVARKCSFKDGYKKFKKKVSENFPDKKILGTSFLRMSEDGRDFGNEFA